MCLLPFCYAQVYPSLMENNAILNNTMTDPLLRHAQFHTLNIKQCTQYLKLCDQNKPDEYYLGLLRIHI